MVCQEVKSEDNINTFQNLFHNKLNIKEIKQKKTIKNRNKYYKY